MKILGVGNDKYICEIEYDEVYALIDQSGEEDFEVEAGQEIDIVRVIKAANYLRDLDQIRLKQLVKDLQTTLAGVEKVQTTAESLNLFATLKDETL